MKALATIIALAACGGDPSSGGPDADTSHIDPKLIAGGGVTNAPLSGLLHVYVVELDSSMPIANASVRVGLTPPLTGTTDATGLVTFTNAALTAAQTITATGSGHVPTTWIGVIGANATLPLEPSPHTIPTAHVAGTIAGWGNLPAPSSLAHYNLGVVLYSFLDDPSAVENTIAQPVNGTTPLNTCVRTAVSNPACAWEMNARVGRQIHTAVIVDGNTNGTNNDTSDDTYTLIGYASGDPVTLTSGQQLANESLAMVTDTQAMTVSLGSPPSGLPHAIAVPELSIPDVGRVVIPLPQLAGSNLSTRVLTPTGKFTGSYHLVGLATPNATTKTPFSSSFPADAAPPLTWLAPPTVIAGPTFSIAGAGSFRTAQLARGTQTVWNVAVLDATTSFSLPAISPDPIGGGTITFAATTAEAAFTAGNFDIPSIKKALTRAAGAQTTFTH